MQLWEKYTKEELNQMYVESKTAREFFHKIGYKNYDSKVKNKIKNKFPELDFNKFTQGKFQDLTGKTFGYLTVLSKSKYTDSSRNSYWNCKCACGKILDHPIAGMKLKNGHTKSCGCKRGELRIKNTPSSNLSGQRFGKLIAIDYIGNSYWKCLCDCGNETNVRADHLKRGEITTCGCSIQNIGEKRQKDISGKVFGYLKAISINQEKTKQNTGTYWNCQCLRCNTITTARLDWLQSGRKISCGCIISYKEEEIASFLDQHSIKYERQYKFNDLKDKQQLRFDFAIFNKDKLAYLIEYQGEQHYVPIKAWGGQEEFENIRRRDKMKVEYCNNHNIPLIILNKNNSIEDCLRKELLN